MSERPEKAAAREVKEETGLIVNVLEILGVYLIKDKYDNNIDIIYISEIIPERNQKKGSRNSPIKISLDFREFSEARWFEINKLPDKIAFNHRNALKDFAIRKHHGY